MARRCDVNTNRVFTRRKLWGETAQAAPASQMVPVMVVPDPPGTTAPNGLAEVIEIELPRGYRVRVGSNVKGSAVRLVLDALERR